MTKFTVALSALTDMTARVEIEAETAEAAANAALAGCIEADPGFEYVENGRPIPDSIEVLSVEDEDGEDVTPPTAAGHVRRFLDLSTAHLSPAARDWLENKDWADSSSLPGGATSYGWFVYAPAEFPMNDDEMPPELAGVLRFARSHGTDYVLFDRDAMEIDGLPTFPW